MTPLGIGLLIGGAIMLLLGIILIAVTIHNHTKTGSTLTTTQKVLYYGGSAFLMLVGLMMIIFGIVKRNPVAPAVPMLPPVPMLNQGGPWMSQSAPSPMLVRSPSPQPMSLSPRGMPSQ